MEHPLSEKWVKASIMGTIWAASEIVLGSFLHNLKVPFSGNILTAIGIVILISMSYKWTEKGLFWRAGLICAFMKTMSPSAVIFGPMIAIIAESLILELFTRLSGRTYAGYILGAMVAMSWNLLQKIINYIIFYGASIVDVYVDLLKLAQKQLNINTDLVWLPIIVLLIVYAIFGLLAAVTGIRVGRRMLRQPSQFNRAAMKEPAAEVAGKPGRPFNYSVAWLIVNVILIILSFFLLNKTHWIVWSLTITVIIIVWSLRYRRAFRQLSKPGFWIFFVIITLITAFVFTRAQSGENMLQKGLLTGFQMNFRAALIITGFSVLGTELYNPVIRRFFLRTSFRNLPLALELSAESLPSFIANIPDFKTLIKNPVSIFYQVISQAESRFTEIKSGSLSRRKIFIVTGAVGDGKTTFIRNLAGVFRENSIESGGVLSERVMNDGHVTGYDLVNIKTGQREVLLRENGECGTASIGRYSICLTAVETGNNILISLVHDNDTIVVIDEVGLLELRGEGWAESLDKLFKTNRNHLILAVRNTFLERVIERWDLNDPVIFDVTKTTFNDAFSLIRDTVS
jgi:nucleoside-triphosphatase THEP1